MTSMQTRTVVDPLHTKIQLAHQEKFLALGSCFAVHIGHKLNEMKFAGAVNPYGTIFNPVSLNRILTYDLSDPSLHLKRTICLDERNLNYDFHSSIHGATPEELNKNITQVIQSEKKNLENASFILITLGTAIIYRLKADLTVVANCHKQPTNLFTKEILDVDQIFESLCSISEIIKASNPAIQIIWTVSPVRHLKEGLTTNSLSKAHLLTAIHRLVTQDTASHYFPAYEILIDDLRDYRYYTSDMIHPSSVAMDYVWNIFETTYCSKETQELNKKVHQINLALKHRPFNPNSSSHLNFVKKTRDKMIEIQEKFGLDFNMELAQFK